MESSATLELAKHTLLVFGIILGIGTFSGLLARLARVPDVVVFLLVGMLIGPGMLGFVDIKADSTIQYQKVVDVLDLIGRLEITQLGLVTQRLVK